VLSVSLLLCFGIINELCKNRAETGQNTVNFNTKIPLLFVGRQRGICVTLLHTLTVFCMSYTVGNILMVDDDIEDYGFLCEALLCIDNKVQCQHAGDGEHAFHALTNGTVAAPDMILLDINMPRWNGRDFMQAIRQKGLVPHVPVNIFSTYVSDEDKTIFAQLGASGFYRKPDTVSEMVELLKTILLHTNQQLMQRMVYPVNNQASTRAGHPVLAYRRDL
jgi:DNA-binding response OmpR family regulator